MTYASHVMVDKYLEAFEKSDLDIIREIYADDAVVEDPAGTEPRQGIDAILEFYTGAFTMNISLSLTGPVRQAASAVAFPFRLESPDMKIDVIDVFELGEDGKVVKMTAYWGPSNMS